MNIFIVLCICIFGCSTLFGGGNPVKNIFEDELVLYINFDDGKGAPLLMEGDIRHVPGKNAKFTERGIFGKAFSGGSMSYRLDFNGVDFTRDTTFVYWIALTHDNPEIDAKTFNQIYLNGRGATLLMQRQGWKKSANILSVLAIPKKRGPFARIFGVSSVKKWKVGEWHMVATSWTAGALSITIDGNKHVSQTPLQQPLAAYYGDKTGKIHSLGLGLPANCVAVDEIMVFNRRLSPEELKKLYDATVEEAGGIQK